jgi:hypothetical protein
MPTTASSARTLIWSTAKSTDVSRSHVAFAMRLARPGAGRSAGRRAAMVAMAAS